MILNFPVCSVNFRAMISRKNCCNLRSWQYKIIPRLGTCFNFAWLNISFATSSDYRLTYRRQLNFLLYSPDRPLLFWPIKILISHINIFVFTIYFFLIRCFLACNEADKKQKFGALDIVESRSKEVWYINFKNSVAFSENPKIFFPK